MAGSAAFFSQYPLLMQNVFGIPPGISSAAFAIVAGLGLALYLPAGNCSEHYGSTRVIRAALRIRWLAYIGLFVLGFTHLGFQNWWALFAFVFVVCAWSLSVSGTTLTTQLSPVGEGEGLGIFNAANALAGALGSSLGLDSGAVGIQFHCCSGGCRRRSWADSKFHVACGSCKGGETNLDSATRFPFTRLIGIR